jgi:hypothetical protein
MWGAKETHPALLVIRSCSFSFHLRMVSLTDVDVNGEQVKDYEMGGAGAWER